MRMLEKDTIQTRGFHNIKKNGEVVGFQFRLRSTYYRGLFLSQIRFGKVIVDGVEYKGDDVIWCINDVDYYASDMANLGYVFWHNQEAAVIKIKKPGGLEQGYHNVEIRWGYTQSYIPPELQSFDFESDTNGRRNSPWPSKRMLIV